MLEYEKRNFGVPKVLAVDNIEKTAMIACQTVFFAQVVPPILALLLCEMMIENLLSE